MHTCLLPSGFPPVVFAPHPFCIAGGLKYSKYMVALLASLPCLPVPLFMSPQCLPVLHPLAPACHQIYKNFHGRPGWRVVTKTDDMARDYASSKFCLAAPGGGWGKRGIVSAMWVLAWAWV